MSTPKTAVLYRMALGTRVCPFGTKAKDLLESRGYQVEDNILTTREETDAFKAKHNVKTTPLVFIDNVPIGGYDDVRGYLG